MLIVTYYMLNNDTILLTFLFFVLLHIWVPSFFFPISLLLGIYFLIHSRVQMNHCDVRHEKVKQMFRLWLLISFIIVVVGSPTKM